MQSKTSPNQVSQLRHRKNKPRNRGKQDKKRKRDNQRKICRYSGSQHDKGLCLAYGKLCNIIEDMCRVLLECDAYFNDLGLVCGAYSSKIHHPFDKQQVKLTSRPTQRWGNCGSLPRVPTSIGAPGRKWKRGPGHQLKRGSLSILMNLFPLCFKWKSNNWIRFATFIESTLFIYSLNAGPLHWARLGHTSSPE